MVIYSLSPGAYDGLVALAQDPRWCRDYQRILRYLEAAARAQEAARMGGDVEEMTCSVPGWKLVAFLEQAEHLLIRRPRK